jgi:hypothetical protein
MPAFLFRCPITRLNVQAFMADEVEAPNDVYKTVKCVACQLFHIVNPKTGRTAWDNGEADAS